MRKSILLIVVLLSSVVYGSVRQVIDLSGDGWKLWHDKEAAWRAERIFMTPLDVHRLPVVAPTKGWEVLTSSEALSVKVPGSVEEYLQEVSGPEGDIEGVTWWTRTLQIPSYEKGQRVMLKFASIRSRAEVFINRKLVDYQIVDNTPFNIDVTAYVHPGEKAQLSLRITDAGGNYDWRDSKLIQWGEKTLPPGHAFGGVTGRVSMEICADVYASDIYMQNTPQRTTANAIVTIHNTLPERVQRTLSVLVCEWKNPRKILFEQQLNGVLLERGENEVCIPIVAPSAKLWDVNHPNLYTCTIRLKEKERTTDLLSQRFGFRWFEATGIGENAVFRLNGKRIVLRSAISWSFWPINGIYPTDELAERQVRTAKELGLNMLNFHRFIGSTNVLNYADEYGLLYFEEPGGYRVKVGNEFLNANLREKVLRMVKRDRSHPSLVIYNMMNESGSAPADQLAVELEAMQAMHRLDPSRYVLRTSAWAKADFVDDQAKIHLRPNDTTVYWNGWYDYHRAGGPAVWNEALYKSPTDYYNNTTNSREIVFFGEEGALSAPPRLAKNKEELDKTPNKGWDGREYLRWYDEFERFLTEKQLRSVYPTVDSLTVAMGSVSFEHQGRKIESARLNNFTDAYVVNGWESELIENFSGIVDCFRYPKSNPSIIARYNRPLYIAVKNRQQVVESGKQLVTDCYIVNEKDVKGTCLLRLSVVDPNGVEKTHLEKQVTVSGGEIYGELLAADLRVSAPLTGGLCRIKASLMDTDHREITSGYDDFLSVDLSSNQLKGKGAVWENGRAVQDFLNNLTSSEIKPYADGLGKLDWVIVARPPYKEQLTMIPTEAFRTADGRMGLDVVYYEDMDFRKEIHREVSKVVNLSVIEGATPSPFVPMLGGYGIIWSGTILPPADGEYTFRTQSNDRSMIDLIVNGKKIYEISQNKEKVGDGKVCLTKGVPVKLEVRFKHPRSNARCRLDWAVPDKEIPNAQALMDRVKADGTSVFVLENTLEWLPLITANSRAQVQDHFFVGTNWLGGVMFNKDHPIFNELPSNGALNWPYQALIHTGVERMGVLMSGEELLVGAYHTYPMALGTAMGVIAAGKGKVLFSTLDIYGNIVNPTSAGLVAKKLLLNMIDLRR